MDGFLKSSPKYLMNLSEKKKKKLKSTINFKKGKSRNLNLPKVMRTSLSRRNKILETGIGEKFKDILCKLN